jgi:putative membrane protein
MDDNQQSANELGIQRNILAAERTLMAWVRTSLSMIGFGFTIFKVMQVFLSQGHSGFIRPNESRNLGLTLISLGIFTLFVASIQHFKYMQRINSGKSYMFWKDLSFIVACLLVMIGLLMFGNIILQFGPFD